MSRRGMTAKGRATGGGGEGEIDLTPMLDVVFIMLIFFIVTSSFVKEPGIDIDRAEALTTSACERGTIIFAVTSVGDIYYDKKEVPIGRAFRLAEAAVEALTLARHLGQQRRCREPLAEGCGQSIAAFGRIGRSQHIEPSEWPA